MGHITILETTKYLNISRPTVMHYLKRGVLTGRKTGDSTSMWLIDADVVEGLRLRRVAQLTRQLDAISTPVALELVA